MSSLVPAEVSSASADSDRPSRQSYLRILVEDMARNVHELGYEADDQQHDEVVRQARRLQRGDISLEDFRKVCEVWLKIIPGVTPWVERCDIVTDLVNRAQTEHNAAELRKRELGTIKAAQVLDSGQIHLAATIKEVIGNEFDYNSNLHLDAESKVTRDFVTKEIWPFIQDASTHSGHSQFADKLKSKKLELKAKWEAHKVSVELHFRKSRDGIDSMESNRLRDYSVQTNHIRRYAAASLLEVLLLHCLVCLYSIVPVDMELENKRRALLDAATERSVSLRKLFETYATARTRLLRIEQESSFRARLGLRYSTRIMDQGAKGDQLCSPTTLPRMSRLSTDADIDFEADETLRVISNDEGRGNYIFSMAERDIATLLAPGGVIWRRHFQLVVECMRRCASDADSRALEIEPTGSSMPKTQPLYRLSNLGLLAGWKGPPDKGDRFYVLYSFMGSKRVVQLHAKELSLVVSSTVVKLDQDDLPRCELVTSWGSCRWVGAVPGRIPDGAVNFGEHNTDYSADVKPCYLGAVSLQFGNGTVWTYPAHLELVSRRGGFGIKEAQYCKGLQVHRACQFMVLCRRV